MLLKLSMRMLRLMHCLFPIPESIFAALLSTKPWSLSFPKATKEGEINKAREGTTWIKQSVKSDMPYNGVNVPTQGTGFRWEWMDFLLRHCLLCPVFVPLFFERISWHIPGWPQIHHLPPSSGVLGLVTQGTTPTPTLVLNHSPEFKMSSNSLDRYSVGWSILDTKISGQIMLSQLLELRIPNIVHGFLFGILRSNSDLT